VRAPRGSCRQPAARLLRRMAVSTHAPLPVSRRRPLCSRPGRNTVTA
jgi:hypothetical protein